VTRWRLPALVAAAALAVGCGTTGQQDGSGVADDVAIAGPRDESDATDDADGAPGSADVGAEETEEGAAEPVLQVVATVAPIADLVARVGGERVAVVALVPPGADSHTYEPRPQDVAVLDDADAYVGVGLDLNEGAVDLAEQHLAADAPVILLGELALQDDELVLDHTHDDGPADDGHTHRHGDDGHTHRHGEDGEELGPNPHVWTSVRNASAMVAALADELSALDPEGAERYEVNTGDLLAELETLDEDIGTAIATVPDEHRTLVTYHDAWTYFARDHGLRSVTAVQPGDFSEPSAAEVREVIDLLRELDVPAIFGSEVFPSRVLDAIAAETEAIHVGDLADDALPGVPGAPEHSYAEMMRRNAITIVEALGGDATALAR
jgi:ABC-type Zn uptake system ZnuABC Zn-binding protein ZnuA